MGELDYPGSRQAAAPEETRDESTQRLLRAEAEAKGQREDPKFIQRMGKLDEAEEKLGELLEKYRPAVVKRFLELIDPNGKALAREAAILEVCAKIYEDAYPEEISPWRQ